MGKSWTRLFVVTIGFAIDPMSLSLLTSPLAAQTSPSTYQPKFPGGPARSDSPPAARTSPSPSQPNFPVDPARSDSEAAALAYMRGVMRAQRRFQKQSDHF